LKTLTVPKLELCGAELLSRLIAEVAGTSAFEGKVYCWSDSAVALSWIRDEPSRYCHSRVNWVSGVVICSNFFKSIWHSLPRELNESILWAHGPKLLCGPKADWPTPITAEKPTLEVRRRILLTKSPYEDLGASSKFANSFAALQRIFGYVYKFSNRIHRPTLTVSDVQGGTLLLLRLVQRSHLWDDTKSLQSKGMVHSSSSLISFAIHWPIWAS